jgi:hypothetical protein
MPTKHADLIKKYLQLPQRLEDAVAGLSESALDLTCGEGWSIRAYVHHTVEGELMWQLFLRAILGKDGIEIPIDWFFGFEQEHWVRAWVYEKRRIEPTLELFRGSTATLAELLRNLPPDAWEYTGLVRWPGDSQQTRLTVRAIVMMHIRHVDGHTADIRTIRSLHSM